jgi:CRP-like cAMP-binding protein
MEAVIQIINAGSSINDIFNDKFQVNIEAVNDSTILSISSQQFKKFIKENANLANNVLLDISLKNKNFIDQLVQLKMANSKQKVGQFLLGMAFEKGSKAKNIELNFDKSVIASYLGIKPETLSRTLKKLKKDREIAVEKNKITLLRENSLCGFCNSKITIKCHRYNSSFCEQNPFH